MQVDIKVAQLLASRLCHDLVGPVGAINAGLELMEEGQGGKLENDSAARDLLANSAGVATRRLSFLRIAFGFGAGVGGEATLAHARELAQGWLETGKATLDWPEDAPAQPAEAVDPGLVKVVLNLVMIAAEALPRGGDVGINFAALDGCLGVAVTAGGDRASLDDGIRYALELEPGLEGEAEGLTARNVHGFYAQSLARNLNTRIEFSEGSEGSEGEIQFGVLFPKATYC